MSNAIDLTGKQFGKLTVLERDYNYVKEHNLKQNRPYWKCKCSCGNIITVCGSNLTKVNGQQQCKQCSNKEKIHNLEGQVFNNLQVLRLAPTKTKDRKAKWICKCKCGNIVEVIGKELLTGHTKSCGCLKHELAINNLVGQRFSKLLVLKNVPAPDEIKNKSSYWLCKCDCGNQVIVSGSKLVSGNTKSCGCLTHEPHSYLDLTGKHFGKLTVIKKVIIPNKTFNGVAWLCKCECGKEKIVSSTNLLTNQTKSCGCLVSKGEDKITTLLIENNIPFIAQKTFDTCRFESGYCAKFDFYIDNSFLLQFDGIQHFKYFNNGWGNKENLLKVHQRDQFKNEWCKNNNIPLKRIPFWELDNLTIEDILSDKYLIN